ncbi:MAG: hypothetical protein IPK54_10575 [Dokdonella sp.]|uniref:hypothetical protein n=1 Tax=Dokdonella sp. TaxID=2291710 RepID=UPI0025C70B60|nr:hypothetical protein [Dokdonella sp.]MBK8123975.1 hypothetical protein [Dokdonella sp.]
MKKSDIRIGVTYVNRGAGNTQRRVVDKGLYVSPDIWMGAGPRPDEEGVYYEQVGWFHEYPGTQQRHYGKVYLSAFARWAGGVVKDSLTTEPLVSQKK